MEKILYVEMSGYGNLVLSTPLLKALRKLYPPSNEIHVVCWPRSARIIEGLSCIDSVVSSHNFRDYLDFFGKIDKADEILISPVGSIWNIRDMAGFCKNIPRKISVKPPWTRHESDIKCDYARQLGFEGEMPCPEVHLDKTNKAIALGFMTRHNLIPNNYICINASYLKSDHWYLKHWGNANWAKLVHKIDFEFNLPIVIVGDKTDKENANWIRNASCIDNVINACGISNDIKDTAAILKHAKIVIGNDGGLQHIAAALGTPNISLFTFTNVIKNAPLGPNSHVVVKDEECPNRLMCQHGQYNMCRCLDIPAKNVFNKVKEVLSE